jgi:hypothetical protein
MDLTSDQVLQWMCDGCEGAFFGEEPESGLCADCRD